MAVVAPYIPIAIHETRPNVVETLPTRAASRPLDATIAMHKMKANMANTPWIPGMVGEDEQICNTLESEVEERREGAQDPLPGAHHPKDAASGDRDEGPCAVRTERTDVHIAQEAENVPTQITRTQ